MATGSAMSGGYIWRSGALRQGGDMWGKYESFTFQVCHSTFLEKVKEQTTIQTFSFGEQHVKFVSPISGFISGKKMGVNFFPRKGGGVPIRGGDGKRPYFFPFFCTLPFKIISSDKSYL